MENNIRKLEYNQGLKAARLWMVLSSLSPLFILWAIRGNNLIPDEWFVPTCLTVAIVPTAILFYRIRIAKKNSEKREIAVGISNNRQSDILIYLFTILLPFYREEITTCRDFAAMMVALGLIIFLFWHLRFHYMNIWFAICGYHIFWVTPPKDRNPYTGQEPFALITRRRFLWVFTDLSGTEVSDKGRAHRGGSRWLPGKRLRLR